MRGREGSNEGKEGARGEGRRDVVREGGSKGGGRE